MNVVVLLSTFPSGVNRSRFEEEVRSDGSITTPLLGSFLRTVDLVLVFNGTPSGAEQTQVQNLASVHVPDPTDFQLAQSDTGASRNPLNTDDETVGVEIGDIWINTGADTRWVCIDNTADAAEWDQVVNDTQLNDTINGFQTPIGVYAFARTDANANILGGFGLTVTSGGTGIYNYLFSTPLPDANYSIAGNPINTTTDTNFHIPQSSVTNEGFQLRIGIGDNSTSADVLANTAHSVTISGPQGFTGVTSAYQTWLSVGNVGTEQDFLNSLQGPPGIPGSANGQEYFSAYSTSNATFTGAEIIVPMDTLDFFPTATFVQESGGVRVTETGLYKIEYHVTAEITSGRARSNARTRLILNGTSTIPGSLGSIYGRQAANFGGTAGSSRMRNLTANDLIQVGVVRSQGSDTYSLVLGGNSIVVTKL